MKTYGFTEQEAQEILEMEQRRRTRLHDEWCNEHEGEFTDADGIQTMANYDSFWKE